MDILYVLSLSSSLKSGLLRVGDVDLSTPCDDVGAVVYPVISSRQHPRYRRPSAYFDVAVLTLPGDGVTFGRYALPVCLPGKPQTDPDTNANKLVREVKVVVQKWKV